MKEIDNYSYQCGVMDCFNEMVKVGLKKIALAHPCHSKQERDCYIEYAQYITEHYHTKYYLDDDPLVTDLFPYSLNQNTFNIIFYKDDHDIEIYNELKKQKRQALESHQYDLIRESIAYQMGYLLSYNDETIRIYIESHEEKE